MTINKNTRPLLFIISLWIFIQTGLLLHFGIVTDGESLKYIREANNLINSGGLSSPNFWMYSTQIFIVSLSLKLKLGYEFVVALQMFGSLLATLSIYKLSTFFFNRITGLLAVVVFLFNLQLQQFNTFLQSDSLFYSLTIIFSCYLLQIKGLSVKVMITLLLALILISLTRPTGLFFFPATFLYLYFRFFKEFTPTYKIFILIAITVTFFYLLDLAISSGGELDFMQPAREEMIICGVPTLSYSVSLDLEKGNSLYSLFHYITHNFSQFARLASQRSLAFFGTIRPYYNPMHNLYLIVLFFPIYLAILFSLKYWIKQNPITLLYFLSLIIFTWITVILSCDDWHNRFLLTISPYLIILALPSIDQIFSRSTRFKSN